MAKDISELASVIDAMRDIKDSIQRLEERYELLKQTVIEHLQGESEGLIGDTPVVTYTEVTQRRFDSNWLKTNMPDVYEANRRPVTSTRFQLVDETR